METRAYLAVPGDCAAMVAGDATLYSCVSTEPRRACGKALYGPLMVLAQSPFTLSLREPAPAPGRRGFVTLTDGCGDQLPMPLSGQEFYLALPPDAPASRYQLTLTSGDDSATMDVAITSQPAPVKPQITAPGAGKGMKLKKGYR